MTLRVRAITWWAVLPLLSCLALGCRTGGDRPPSAGAGGLTEGPTRWLMLPEEKHEADRLRTSREAVDFVEKFWQRRDPTPEAPGNEFSKTFYLRVEAADHLYAEGGVRGSLTDRGRALILLGPPPILRYSQRRSPTFEPGKPSARPAIQTRNLVLEIWAYPVRDLPPAYVQHFGDADLPEEIILTFRVGSRRTELIEGDRYLEIAAEASVRR